MRLIDLSGQRFGKLTVINRAPNHRGRTMWNCICDCGNKSIISACHLRSGHSTSCGCYKAENMSSLFSIHKMTNTPLYRMYRNMLNRCYYKGSDHYESYGARGITVCDEWKTGFEAFYQWAVNHGYENGLSIDRVDVDGNYCPENCRFIPINEQAYNKQDTRYVNYNGELLPLAKVAEAVGIDSGTIAARMDRWGWSEQDAINTPVRRKAG